MLLGIILVVVTLVVQNIDTSVIYHVVRVQSVIKLYVVYNMLDVSHCYCNRLQTITYFKTFKSLIYKWLNFKNDGFDSKFYFLVEKQQHSIKQFCLKLHTSLDNIV